MRNIRMASLIGESFDRTIEILFRPFSMRKWLRLTLIALLAGMLLGGGGSGGGNNRSTKPNAGKVAASDMKTAGTDESKAAPAPAAAAPSPEAARRSFIMIASIVVAAAVFLIFFLLYMTWIGARLKFVWLNSIIKNTDAIMEPYSRHRREGSSFFGLSLILLTVFISALCLLIGVIIYGMISSGVFQKGFEWTLAVGLKIFLAPAISGIIFIIAFAILAFFADHFIVPIMAFDECTVSQALRKLGAVLKQNWKDAALFTLVFFLLSIVTGIFAGILAMIVVIVLLIMAAVLIGLPFLLLWVALKAKIVFIIYGIAAAIPFIAAILVLPLVVSMPFAVFFRTFSLKYLLSLNVGYGPESLQKYSSRKADRISGRMPVIISIVMSALLVFTLITGVVAAIAIPNFIRAKQIALEKKAAETRSVSVAGVTGNEK
ncbi:MAG: hypothetical protein Q7S30_01070 [Candidatus Omnitrophota bacterium]|nr:hypothetical protein [Candidatus Omnitrophota bacterium]